MQFCARTRSLVALGEVPRRCIHGPRCRGGGSTRVHRATYTHIIRSAATGSQRCAYALNLPCWCFWHLISYARLVLDIAKAEHIDVWCVLRGERDIPAWMHPPDGP